MSSINLTCSADNKILKTREILQRLIATLHNRRNGKILSEAEHRMTDVNSGRQQLHELVEKLQPEQVFAALQFLNFLCADAVLLSLLNAPADDEPYTHEQRQHDADAEASIRRGEGISHEEILREFGV